MKKKLKSSIYLLLMLLIGITLKVNAQSDISAIMQGGITDANKILDGYLAPLGHSFGACMNGGWYNNAKTHKPGKFSLTITPSVYIPNNSVKTWEFNNSDMASLQLRKGTSSINQTIFGTAEDGAEVYLPNPEYETLHQQGVPDSQNPKELVKMNLPPGAELPLMVVPSVQLNVGIYKNTDLSIRFIPTIAAGDFKINLWGIGVIHDVKQWIPAIKLLPLDLSLQAAFSKLKMSYDFGENALMPTSGSIYDDGSIPDNLSKYASQSFAFENSSWSLNVILSKKLSVFTPYASLGLQSWTTTIQILGTYPIIDGVYYNKTNPYDSNNGKLLNKDHLNPINIEATKISPRAVIGFRLKIAFITLHADYTISSYNIASAGIGFSFGENKAVKISDTKKE